MHVKQKNKISKWSEKVLGFNCLELFGNLTEKVVTSM